MTFDIVVDEEKLKELVFDFLCDQLGSIEFRVEDVKIETKSTQNYWSEWESKGGFRATLHIQK
jgi:hypothetical protein